MWPFRRPKAKIFMLECCFRMQVEIHKGFIQNSSHFMMEWTSCWKWIDLNHPISDFVSCNISHSMPNDCCRLFHLGHIPFRWGSIWNNKRCDNMACYLANQQCIHCFDAAQIRTHTHTKKDRSLSFVRSLVRSNKWFGAIFNFQEDTATSATLLSIVIWFGLFVAHVLDTQLNHSRCHMQWPNPNEMPIHSTTTTEEKKQNRKTTTRKYHKYFGIKINNQQKANKTSGTQNGI